MSQQEALLNHSHRGKLAQVIALKAQAHQPRRNHTARTTKPPKAGSQGQSSDQLKGCALKQTRTAASNTTSLVAAALVAPCYSESLQVAQLAALTPLQVAMLAGPDNMLPPPHLRLTGQQAHEHSTHSKLVQQ